MRDPRDELRDWLTAVRNHYGWTWAEWARKANVWPSTVTRFVNEPGYPGDLSRRTVTALAKAAGLEPMQPPGERLRGVAEAEAATYAAGVDEVTDAMVRAATRGRNAVDPWVLRSRALEHEGYVPGDILIVSLNDVPLPGDVVCAQIYDWKAGRAETVFRVLEPPMLVAASSDPRVRRPAIIDGDNVIVRGVVIASVRPRRPIAA